MEGGDADREALEFELELAQDEVERLRRQLDEAETVLLARAQEVGALGSHVYRLGEQLGRTREDADMTRRLLSRVTGEVIAAASAAVGIDDDEVAREALADASASLRDVAGRWRALVADPSSTVATRERAYRDGVGRLSASLALARLALDKADTAPLVAALRETMLTDSDQTNALLLAYDDSLGDMSVVYRDMPALLAALAARLVDIGSRLPSLESGVGVLRAHISYLVDVVIPTLRPT